MNGMLMDGRGVSTSGTKTTVVDTRKDFLADIFNGKFIKIRIDGVDYFRTITDTAGSTLTFATLPGTPAASVWTVDVGVTITTTSVADGGNEYSIVAALATGAAALSATLVGNVITIVLATDAGGAGIDLENTVTLVTAAIDALAEFTAVAGGSGATVVVSATVAFSGGIDEVKPIDGTVYEVAWR